ncbi:hypothetical protein Vadar_028596 [Vaccinium darrowii]|uniref:Uncharacterized protein n=1 Tax=Vaccinium darrowii TaxID=229202 RepID=A0ACB7Y9T5_9ERIC|nr:hypothetical protein Vadar_028596 [Vaccinium darrowii]
MRFLTTIFNSSSSSPSTTTKTASESAAEPPEPVAVEPDFVVVLAALLCALICVVGLIAVARCAWLRRSSTPNGARSANQNKGLKKKVLQSLPKYTFNEKVGAPASAAVGGGGGTECAICLAEYADGDEIRVLPQCGHGFHVVCIDTWLGSHSSCPSCRQILVVTRCRKCGECPAAAAAGARTDVREDHGPSSGGFLPV